MTVFERYLIPLVGLCILTGVVLGHWLFGIFDTVGAARVAQVNLPLAALVWLMIIPMMLRIDFAAIGKVREHWRGIGITVFITWMVKPFSIAALGWFFLRYLFAPVLPAAQVDSYIAGLILLGAAPCTAMVFAWSALARGERDFTRAQIAVNAAIMAFGFAPIIGLLLGLSGITVPWQSLLLSTAIYIIVPMVLGQIMRAWAMSRGGLPALAALLAGLQPVALLALVTTLVLVLDFQGGQIIAEPQIIAFLAVPVLVQVCFAAGLAYLLNRATGEPHCIAAPSALIGASNFFELAVAAAITVYGFSSGAVLITVAGVLIEVPLMLSIVRIANASKYWYESGSGVRRRRKVAS